MLWFIGFSTILLAGVVAAHENSGSSTDCTSVKTKRVSLKKFTKRSPFYLLETSSCTDLGVEVTAIDSVCFGLTSQCNCGTSDIYAITTLKNGSTVITTGTMYELDAGHFFANATTFQYEDFVLDEPCKGLYVIYLCPVNGESSTNNTVLIVSSKRSVDEDCLLEAECKALEVFPDLEFNTMPNTVRNPCSNSCIA